MLKMRVKMIFLVLLGLMLVGCGGKEFDYTTLGAQEALDNGINIEGLTVIVEVDSVEDNPVFGYVMKAGDSMHFVSHVNPKVDEGELKVVTIDRVVYMFGAYTITYEE